MEKRIPKRLKIEPLLEVVLEVRFSSEKTSVDDLLPGLIYKEFKDEFKDIEGLPAKNIPSEIRKNDPNFKYLATTCLKGEIFSVLIGQHVVALSCVPPYPGWDKFETKAINLFDIALKTGLLSKIERVSLKYIDVISNEYVSFSDLNLSINIGGKPIPEGPTQFRTEIANDKFVTILQVLSPAQARTRDGRVFDGILIDVDTFCPLDNMLFEQLPDLLSRAHVIGKEFFFTLLTDETLTRLGAEY